MASRKNTNEDKIRASAAEREIRFLLHFTQAANLPGIVKHGILSRRKLAGPEYSAFASDHYRLDENDDAISLSISRVNEAMFASKRRKSGHDEWVILVLSPEILWTYDCRFCWTNAARKEMKEHRGWCGGPWAFEKMFDGGNEERGDLAPCYPTDPEAEVQVFQDIAPGCILGAAVERPDLAEAVHTTLNELAGAERHVYVDDF